MDLSKQQKLDANPKAKINFTGYLDLKQKVQPCFPLLKKQTVLDFLKGTIKV